MAVVDTAPRRKRGSLTPDEVVAEAGALIEESGVDALTMRRLAERLGVNPMTLYLRFENRDELVGALVASRLQQVLVDPDAVRPPAAAPVEDQMVAWARSVRDALVGLGPLMSQVRDGRHMGGAVLDLTERGLAAVKAAGLDDEVAVAAFRSLFWHAVGFAVLRPSLWAHAPELLEGVELDAATHPNLARLAGELGAFDPDELFERTTRALVAGLVAPSRPDRGEP
ncbi:TetR/AcrR family transcriptional regulator [Dermatobacter hominis]|uniref:TetR/AcrR family transcriptional regulator n=1 Tax=Dermatobacter hominis TaxID=2884263 RepID=UPI001D11C1E2|nr:TetR/AcrR family transcriptional regulator [Dermatobacter hominis]UDY35242.1 TetR/AcrR family transcriptional regulator [Dermatobacter hominis]